MSFVFATKCEVVPFVLETNSISYESYGAIYTFPSHLTCQPPLALPMALPMAAPMAVPMAVANGRANGRTNGRTNGRANGRANGRYMTHN